MHYAIEAYGGVGVQIHVFLASALVGEWSASRSVRQFNPGEEPPVPIG
jgi:hypothetical protein